MWEGERCVSGGVHGPTRVAVAPRLLPRLPTLFISFLSSLSLWTLCSPYSESARRLDSSVSFSLLCPVCFVRVCSPARVVWTRSR